MPATAAAAASSSGINRMALSFLLSLLSDNLQKPGDDTSVKHHWAYRGPEGPDTWHLHYRKCGGSRQSPINIESRTCVYDPDLGPFYLDNFGDVSAKSGSTIMNVTNNGHAASVRVTSQMRVRGGGLPGTYRTAEFHFHWGSQDNVGSEHALDGRKFPLEMHIVNFAEKYGDVKTAMSMPDGLAVLGVFFEVSDMDNGDLSELDGALKHVQKAGEHSLVNNLRLRSLLPDDLSRFWRYQGSLTTPHCFESVTWTVFQQPQKISRVQLETLRSLLYEDGHEVSNRGPAHHNRPSRLVDNWRPLQPRNERLIRRSFKIHRESRHGLYSSSLKSNTDDSGKSSNSISAQNAATIRMLRQKIIALERMVMANVGSGWSNENKTMSSPANVPMQPSDHTSTLSDWTPQYQNSNTQYVAKSTKAPRTTQPALAPTPPAASRSSPQVPFALPSRYIITNPKDTDKNKKSTEQSKASMEPTYNGLDTKLQQQNVPQNSRQSGQPIQSQSRQSQSGQSAQSRMSYLKQQMISQYNEGSQNDQKFADPRHQEILHNILIPQPQPQPQLLIGSPRALQLAAANQGQNIPSNLPPVVRQNTQRFPSSRFSQSPVQSRSLADHISAVNSVASKSSSVLSGSGGISNIGRPSFNTFPRDQKSPVDMLGLMPGSSYDFAPTNSRGGTGVPEAFPQVYLQRLHQPVRIRRPFYERMYNWPLRNAPSVQPLRRSNSLSQTQLLSLHNTQGGELPELI